MVLPVSDKFHALFLVGLPASGKSTFIRELQGCLLAPEYWAVISTDNHIEAKAAEYGKTYSDVFKDTIKWATHAMNADLQDAVLKKHHIIWDQTNISAKTRKPKIEAIPSACYTKTAIYFVPPDIQELTRRLATRPGKEIPIAVIQNMRNGLEIPSKEEGFDHVILYDTTVDPLKNSFILVG